jgi:hypothetical protein
VAIKTTSSVLLTEKKTAQTTPLGRAQHTSRDNEKEPRLTNRKKNKSINAGMAIELRRSKTQMAKSRAVENIVFSGKEKKKEKLTFL